MGGLRQTRPPHALPVAVTIAAAVVAIAGLGGLASDVRSEWYTSLAKPRWQPPGWVFGPVWSVLYALLAVSAFLAWRDAHGPRRRPPARPLRRQRRPQPRLDLHLLSGQAARRRRHRDPPPARHDRRNGCALRPFSRIAAATLVPYGAWVAYASSINWAIAAQN